jgi:hypothetical protein
VAGAEGRASLSVADNSCLYAVVEGNFASESGSSEGDWFRRKHFSARTFRRRWKPIMNPTEKMVTMTKAATAMQTLAAREEGRLKGGGGKGVGNPVANPTGDGVPEVVAGRAAIGIRYGEGWDPPL